MMVFGERRMNAGVQPLNIQPMPSCLNECAMTDEIDACPEAFMICRDSSRASRRGGLAERKSRF